MKGKEKLKGKINRLIDIEKMSAPKGGGAIKGLSEDFSVSPFTGETMGFTLDIPSISRKTSLKIPTYDDHDTFLHSENGELVLAVIAQKLQLLSVTLDTILW